MAHAGRRFDDAPPASTVFVGNLSYDLTEQDVIEHFSQVGPVKHVRIVTERDTGKPRGFGFIEFFDIPTAESAIRNLSGKEFKGRTIRIVYAEGGPGEFRSREFDDRGPPPRFDDRGGPGGMGRRPMRDRVVGGDLAYHASHGVAALLDAPLPPGAPADSITHLLARRSRAELYDYLAQMQGLLQRNPGQARQMLADNPALTKALFQMQVILGMVSNPLGDVAPKGVAPPNLMPRHEPPPHAQPGPGPMGGPPPDMGMPPPHGMEPPHMQRGPPMQGPPMGMQGPPPMGMQGPPPMQQQPGMQPQPPYMQGPPPMEQPGGGGFPQPGYMPPQQQPYGGEPMQPGGPGYGPAQPVDPRRMAGPGAPPRPMMPMGAQPPQPAMPPMQQPTPAPPAAVPAPAGAPGVLTPEQQQALLNQVMSLTPQQIELLPPQQKAQVLALQQQLRQQQQ
ncbi:cleavage stimulating factor 64-like [Chlorella sorokiniana]|uniref:Cleavage stimulating factor 64-like n=1 Tax=Chlorella sorokiniana TaxID=3076 RepID=A0A2P6U036_CHLSO|nr:cleavage stimulating factor 64-like [Chlorella sorokiniana]|eukprot:PRW59679.1 cleavage stimulating factor 64-like [Chlorella sorokiniana]